MKKTGFALAFAVAALVALRPGVASADVAKSRKPAADAKVTVRLVEKGVPAPAAGDQVASLTKAEAEFFAADPSRVQVVGGLAWYEWLSGIGWLLLIALFGYLLADHSNL